jgi:hypothetical protein
MVACFTNLRTLNSDKSWKEINKSSVLYLSRYHAGIIKRNSKPALKKETDKKERNEKVLYRFNSNCLLPVVINYGNLQL